MSDYWTKNGITKPQSIIVCAACELYQDMDGKRYTYYLIGARHFDKLMNEQHKYLGKSHYWKHGEQGFIDQFGDFYNRVDALAIVKASGQPFNAERNGSDEELFSEGLY